ncbi:transposase [Nitrobacteraceae bacterium AZCC 2161]
MFLQKLVKKRSILIDGLQTSVSLEDKFWIALKGIAAEQGESVAKRLRGEESISELCHRKGIAALAGLAPLNTDSGQSRGAPQIHGGRRRVREALYMAAVAVTRTSSRFARIYRSMREAGKPAKLALIAVARKLLVTLNAVVRDQQPFHP